MKGDQQRVRSLLAEAITILCKNTLSYDSEFCIEGLLGITLDKNEVFLVSINENVQGKAMPGPSASAGNSMASHLEIIQQQGALPVPTSRPIPTKSPFMPRRPTFGQRARWKRKGSHPLRPPSRSPGMASLAKRPALDVPAGSAPEAPELVEVTDDDLKQDLASSVSMATKTSNGDNAVADNQTENLLSSLDFSDMVSQNKDNSTSQRAADSDDTIPQDEEGDNSAQADNEEDTFDSDAIIIKPEPESEEDVLRTSVDSGLVFGSGGILASDPAGHAVMSSSALTLSMGSQASYMSPAIAGFSGWPQTVNIAGSSPLSTPVRSGPGRPIAPAPHSQGSPSQSANWTSQVRGKPFMWMGDSTRHFQAYHTREKNYPCAECDYVASKSFNLRRHIIRRHQPKTENVLDFQNV